MSSAITKDIPINVEPRQAYINGILLPAINTAAFLVFNVDPKAVMAGVVACTRLISLLDKQSKEKLKDLMTLLKAWHDNPSPNRWSPSQFPPVSRLGLENVFDKTMDYLNASYLQDVNIGIVPSSSLPQQKERPSSEKTPATLSPRL